MTMIRVTTIISAPILIARKFRPLKENVRALKLHVKLFKLLLRTAPTFFCGVRRTKRIYYSDKVPRLYLQPTAELVRAEDADAFSRPRRIDQVRSRIMFSVQRNKQEKDEKQIKSFRRARERECKQITRAAVGGRKRPRARDNESSGAAASQLIRSTATWDPLINGPRKKSQRRVPSA